MSSLVLASGSAVRAGLLRAAGVPFEVCPAGVDEDDVKAALLTEGADPAAVADALAELKATRVSAKLPQRLVLGCDQVLEFGGRAIDKSPDLAAARALLQQLRGSQHTLVTSCVLAKGGSAIWRRRERASLRMRSFSDQFLEDYLSAEGEAILGSVGCYHLEGRGAQLFEQVRGDYFAVLGLPLIPLLAALREHGIIGR
ncbi:MAG: Maf-like protein [Alphaproteobacteria bacterium]|nr:Maf family protein [Alphaproteobacteria bacterium]MDE2109636.1 Maf-like protein [Alphaproteobacteria bacterium]MDE2493056.1 Maf-like protein [Alphaproteobacteria bacterium]